MTDRIQGCGATIRAPQAGYPPIVIRSERAVVLEAVKVWPGKEWSMQKGRPVGFWLRKTTE